VRRGHECFSMLSAGVRSDIFDKGFTPSDQVRR